MKNKNGEGKKLNWTNSTGADVASGDPVVVGDLIGIAEADIANGSAGVLDIDGEFTLVKANDEAFAQGDTLFLNTTTNKVTKTAAGNTRAGCASEAAAETAIEAQVKINVPSSADLGAQAALIADPTATAAMTQDDLTDSSTGTPGTTLAAVTAPAAITDSSGGVDPANDTIAEITNAQNAGSADVLPTAAAIAQLAAKLNVLTTAVGVLTNAVASLAAQQAKSKADDAALVTAVAANNTAIDALIDAGQGFKMIASA